MWPYHPQLLATPVPRYTSYPTAAEFTDDIGPADLAEAISAATGEVSLYIHIPFCEKICWYCGCNTAAANRAQRLASYLEALHREIALVAALLPANARVTRISFGGGSPNALAPVDFVHLFEQLVIKFPLDKPVVSVELDPRTLTPEWKAVLAGIGASHASMGVQTFAPRLQQAIGRVQPMEMIEKGVTILRAAGITSMNFDLMYGLPGQTMEELDESLDYARRFGADRIALFGYAHVPGMFPRQRQIDDSQLPGSEQRFAMAARGHERLVEAGYQAIGFDHFALPSDPLAVAAREGRLRRNFQGFTEDQAPRLIGLGASAISAFPGLLAQNEKNSGRYRMLLSQDELTATRGKRRTIEDRRCGAIIEELLCRGRARVDAATLDAARDRLAPYIESGLCAIDNGAVTIGEHAVPYARSIAAAFDPYRQVSARKFSSAI
ncbi:oxygen-independent coproporphyrinogen III oxidase [Aurantiacibacter poecillastricola]|uniref:oxygen-independent coproporphyrinogen III oxidase n=1 Tax=Aurantiacibacter poecillastricola TaxID=3064385 RepID=UPI00273E574B|nr:oxygen-independent coproporphyrinogen III oxidase [Aurantiacibacter sp. 219JJ12-13]MDP5261386.1 oxygen-independent coproporphyrinogen III oxidase [Aurantiacibacter sp. 219JJ12-13]